MTDIVKTAMNAAKSQIVQVGLPLVVGAVVVAVVSAVISKQ